MLTAYPGATRERGGTVIGSELSSYEGHVSRLDSCERRMWSSVARSCILNVASICGFVFSSSAQIGIMLAFREGKKKTRSWI